MGKQAPIGGEQLLYDADKLIEDLKQHKPDLLKNLSENAVVIKKGAGEAFYEGPIIDLGGKYPELRWNFYRTEKDNDATKKMCVDFFEFLAGSHCANSINYLHCQTGDCFILNDLALLHGRNSFETKEDRGRILYQSMWKKNEKKR